MLVATSCESIRALFACDTPHGGMRFTSLSYYGMNVARPFCIFSLLFTLFLSVACSSCTGRWSSVKASAKKIPFPRKFHMSISYGRLTWAGSRHTQCFGCWFTIQPFSSVGDVKLCLKRYIMIMVGAIFSFDSSGRSVLLFFFLWDSMGYILYGEDTVALSCYAMVFNWNLFCYGC